MSTIGLPERHTQSRVLELFTEELGYRYLGDWTDQRFNELRKDLRNKHIFVLADDNDFLVAIVPALMIKASTVQKVELLRAHVS